MIDVLSILTAPYLGHIFAIDHFDKSNNLDKKFIKSYTDSFKKFSKALKICKLFDPKPVIISSMLSNSDLPDRFLLTQKSSVL